MDYLDEPSSRPPFGLILSIILNIGLLVAVYYFFKQGQDLRENIAATKAATEARMAETEEAHAETVATMEKNFSLELEKLNGEWSARLAGEKAQQQEKLARVFEQVDQLVHNSDEAIGYIATLEGKLREGRQLEKQELDSLEALYAGLNYLKGQYQKPIHEFRELDQFLVQQLNLEPMEHEQKGRFFKRMFSKDYRDAERDYYRDQGRRQAFATARERVATAYAKAQREMAAISASQSNYLADLQAIIAGEQADLANLDAFLVDSRKVIDIHKGIMNLQQEQETQQVNP